MSQPQSSHYDVIIIGAGASGLMCAATAGYQGLSVLVLDHAPKAAAKIRISGGGKCNFTNLDVSPKNYICQNPHFVKSALSRYSSQQFIELVERHGLEFEQRELGKLFCKERASDLIQILRTECDWAQVEFALNVNVAKITASESSQKRFALQVTDKESTSQLTCHNLVVATGALSFPKLKASDFGYRIAKQFSIPMIATRPGLVPLFFEGKWQQRFAELTGVAFDAEVSCNGFTFKEAVLMTHVGLSGPAILQVSNYWREGQPIQVNPFPDVDLAQVLLELKAGGKKFSTWLNHYWSKRQSKAWLEWFPCPEDLANTSDQELHEYAQKSQSWMLYPAGTGGYAKAEVTLGGVDTDYISSKTFEASTQKGLYFIGEVLDVTGQLGGFNFQWAWASGVACGMALQKN